MDDGITVEIIEIIQDPLLQFLLRSDANMPQQRARHLGEEPFDEIEPRPVLGSEHEGEAAIALCGEPLVRLFGNVCGVIVEDDLDGRVSRIGGVELLEESNELARTMQACTFPVSRSMPANRLNVPWRLYSWSRARQPCLSGIGGRSGPVLPMA